MTRRELKEASRLVVAPATEELRQRIYQVRHDVYARELGQHAPRQGQRLTDALDAFNTYLTVTSEGELLGFVSITPPGHGCYSIDKYLDREELPFPCDAGLYEVRLLTVVQAHRGGSVAALLILAAFRWVEARGGTRMVIIGRRELLPFYRRLGLQPCGRSFQSGAVTFELMSETLEVIRTGIRRFTGLIDRLRAEVDWQVPAPMDGPTSCFHGGAFFSAIGEEFDHLERRHQVIHADVLDAWFPPAPGVLEALNEHLPWLVSTSPPTDAGGLTRVIGRERGVDPASFLPGSGSSSLIFLALREWLRSSSRVLLLDPCYGEYAHVLEAIIGCRTERLPLPRPEGYLLDPERLAERLSTPYDLVVLVNPNNPTGRHLPGTRLAEIIQAAPPETRFWIDETYVEYAGAGQSLERFASESRNTVVCKSMSKAYALSGARVGYLCGPPPLVAELRRLTPPWAVSLPAQVAAVKALESGEYYAARYRETAALREQLAEGLRALGITEIVPGVANFLLCHLPEDGPNAEEVVQRCRKSGLFLRNAGRTSTLLGSYALRLAVKDQDVNRRMLQILGEVLTVDRNCGVYRPPGPVR